MGKTGYLVLENGRIFQGERFGADGEMTAEVVFTTGMTGYLETLTDRSYWGQMVVQTFPLIGNYGVIPADFESDVIGPCAYIVKHWCQAPSNFRSEGSLDTFFQERGVIGLSGIDTRTLTKIIRETGVMNGTITDDPSKVDFEKLKAYRVTGAVKASSTKERYVVRPEGDVKKKIALLDFGLKKNIYRELVKRGAEVTVCPCDTTAQEIRELGVDGIMLSNGPGDPAENPEIIGNLKEICQLGIPLFGICLGHQLLALAHGCADREAEVRPPGRQPAGETPGDRKSLHLQPEPRLSRWSATALPESKAKELFVNVNDHTCEGMRYLDMPRLFRAVPSGGLRRPPGHPGFLFDQFVAMMKEAE